jgi:cobalt-precorrin-5B (C1)-methyltransferase
LARHPVPRLTVAGGIGKMAKLAQGAMDLHSGRSQVDFARLALLATRAGADPAPVAAAGTALEALALAGPGLAQAVADEALAVVRRVLGSAPVAAEVIVVGRDGAILGRA